eukprot:scaffold73277_cov69-Phaeocystis_antarctica.AAC.1
MPPSSSSGRPLGPSGRVVRLCASVLVAPARRESHSSTGCRASGRERHTLMKRWRARASREPAAGPGSEQPWATTAVCRAAMSLAEATNVSMPGTSSVKHSQQQRA